MSLNVETLGQVFTPSNTVDFMLSLRKNNGPILEPSCGSGAFSNKIDDCIAIELDESVAPENAIIMNFFDYPIDNKFDTIIGNPPYVRYQDIDQSTKSKLDMNLFDARSNLYLFFIYKCVQHLNAHGELIFLVPRDFLKSTSSIKLNEFLYNNGTITDIVDLGDARIFDGASPNCVVFRYEKGDFTRIANRSKTFMLSNGQLLFLSETYDVAFSDIFFVRVGGVSGADRVFARDSQNAIDFVYSKTCSTSRTRRMIYNVKSPELEPYKPILLQRGIKKFDERNWYMWGRNYYKSDKERIYVNCKTRNANPFFHHDCKAYDGSVLAIFPKYEKTASECIRLAKELNNANWQELGFVCDGRFLFTQKSLEGTVLPSSFKEYIDD